MGASETLRPCMAWHGVMEDLLQSGFTGAPAHHEVSLFENTRYTLRVSRQTRLPASVPSMPVV